MSAIHHEFHGADTDPLTIVVMIFTLGTFAVLGIALLLIFIELGRR